MTQPFLAALNEVAVKRNASRSTLGLLMGNAQTAVMGMTAAASLIANRDLRYERSRTSLLVLNDVVTVLTSAHALVGRTAAIRSTTRKRHALYEAPKPDPKEALGLLIGSVIALYVENKRLGTGMTLAQKHALKPAGRLSSTVSVATAIVTLGESTYVLYCSRDQWLPKLQSKVGGLRGGLPAKHPVNNPDAMPEGLDDELLSKMLAGLFTTLEENFAAQQLGERPPSADTSGH